MRIASRHMPKYRPEPMGLLGGIVLAALAGPFVYLVVAKPAAGAVFIGIFLVWYVLARPGMKGQEEQLRRLAAAREGQSIGDFARELDLRAVDPWVVRAVYERVQGQLVHIHPAFPLRADDRLKEHLHLDDDDVDMDVALEVQQRTGRSLDHASTKQSFGEVRTVRDLVMFFQALPKRDVA
jgi:hypothetical protein